MHKCGQTEEQLIYYHPMTKRHLGIARIVFIEVKSARYCIEKYNGTSVMGKVLNVFHDAFGEVCKQLLVNATSDKKPQNPAHAAAPPAQPPHANQPPLPSSITHQQMPPPPPHSSKDEFIKPHSTDQTDYHQHHSDYSYSRSASVHSKSEDGDWNSSYDDSREKYDEYDSESHRHYRYDKKDSRRWDKEKKHHHYHGKSEKERGRNERDYRSSSSHRRDRDSRGREYDYDYDYRDRDRRDRDRDRSSRDSKYSSYKKDREYLPSTSTDSSGSGYGHASSTYSSHHHFDSSSYHHQYPIPSTNYAQTTNVQAPPLPPSPSPRVYPVVPTQIQPPIPSDPWPKTAPVKPPPEPEQDWDADEVNATKEKKKEQSDKTKYGNDVIDGKTTEQDSESNIDLDTRIAMMFNSKSFGAAPPFLQMDDSESDTEKDYRKPSDTDTALSEKIKSEINTETSDSNNLSQTANDMQAISNDSIDTSHIKKEKKEKCIDDGASDISSDDDLLLKDGTCTPPKSTADTKLDDDKMSLSSLSSTEDKSQPKPPPLPDAQHKNAISTHADYYYPPGTNSFGYYPNGSSTTAYDPYHNSQYMSHPSYMSSYVAGFSALIPGGYVQSNDYSSRKFEAKEEQVPRKDPSEMTVSKVIDRVASELKQILKKDFNKRMIESIAYKHFETWWDDQVQQKNKPTTSSTETASEKPPDINQILNNNNNNNNRDSHDFNGFTLGFRTQMFKLPRFQRIRKIPSPVQLDEDSKKDSDQEDIVRGSDSENDDDDDFVPQSKSTFNEKLKESESKMRKRKAGSVSSFFSSSSEEESSSGAESSDLDSSSLSDIDEILPIPSKPKDVAKKIYSDSDSEDDIKTVPNKMTATKSKLRLYSDTVSEEEASHEDVSMDEMPDDDKEIDDVAMETVKTPEPIDLDESPKLPRTPGRKSPTPEPKKTTTSTSYDYDRLYSDSEEEREYQEKRRRNTEYMEQIEREFIEEQMKQQQNRAGETTEEEEVLPEKAPSPGDPMTPTTLSKLPPTPDVKFTSDPMANHNSMPFVTEHLTKKQAAAKRAKMNELKQKETNGLARSVSLSDASMTNDEDMQKGKLSPASCSSQESQTSHASQVQLEHCYSLPPSASPSLSSPNAQIQSSTIEQQQQSVQQKPSIAPPVSNAFAHDHGKKNCF